MSAQRSVTVEPGLRFGEAGGRSLELDLYRAPDPAAPLALYVHGGGWRFGDRTVDRDRVSALAQYGVTVAAVDYRLVPAATLPDQVHDVKGAVRWLRANGPSLGLDTERIGAWGTSAGAYLASLLGLSSGDPELEGAVGGNVDQSSAVQAVVHWFGQADLLTSGSRTDVEARLLPFNFESGVLGLESIEDDPDRARRFGLLGRATSTAPPFLIAHGDRDHVVAPSAGEALQDALSRAGATTQFLLLGGTGHEGAGFDRPATLAMTAAWLRAVLGRDQS